jgi:hypothetical protein
MHPLSNTGSSFKESATEVLTHTPAIPATSVQLSDPSFPVGSTPSPDTLAFNPTGQRQTDLYGSAWEMAVVSPDPPVSQGEMRDQQISEGSPLVPFEQQLSPSANHGWCPSPGSVPTFAWPIPPSLDHPPIDSTGASQITVSPCAPVDLSVFDWNSIPNPLVETTMPMSTCHLPSLTYSLGSFLGSDRSTRISLCPKLRPRSDELRASRSRISGSIGRPGIQPPLSIG